MINIKKNNIYFIMYHYIKNKKDNKFFNLNVMDDKLFEDQINFLKKKYNIIGNDDLCEILISKKIPKKPSFILTFDDGYKDHFNYVFPFLMKHKLKAIFYPSSRIFEKKYLLDVNKIQLILGKAKDKNKLLKEIFDLIKVISGKNRNQLDLKKINLKSRYDSKEIILIKRLLQLHLNDKLRKKIINKLFNNYFNSKEIQYFDEFYINKKDALEMSNNGMSFGIHGYNHYWLNSLTYKQQESEINLSLNNLKTLKLFKPNLSICYPYGAYDKNTIKISNKFNFKFAVTTKPNSLNKFNLKKIYEIPRYDCNDLIS